MKNKNPRNNKIDDFYCVFCGRKGFPIVRVKNDKEPGHLKKLFCLYCNKETNHVEISFNGKYTLEDFLCEFNNKNFDEEGNRYDPSYKHFEALIRGDLDE